MRIAFAATLALLSAPAVFAAASTEIYLRLAPAVVCEGEPIFLDIHLRNSGPTRLAFNIGLKDGSLELSIEGSSGELQPKRAVLRFTRLAPLDPGEERHQHEILDFLADTTAVPGEYRIHLRYAPTGQVFRLTLTRVSRDPERLRALGYELLAAYRLPREEHTGREYALFQICDAVMIPILEETGRAGDGSDAATRALLRIGTLEAASAILRFERKDAAPFRQVEVLIRALRYSAPPESQGWVLHLAPMSPSVAAGQPIQVSLLLRRLGDYVIGGTLGPASLLNWEIFRLYEDGSASKLSKISPFERGGFYATVRGRVGPGFAQHLDYELSAVYAFTPGRYRATASRHNGLTSNPIEFEVTER